MKFTNPTKVEPSKPTERVERAPCKASETKDYNDGERDNRGDRRGTRRKSTERPC